MKPKLSVRSKKTSSSTPKGDDAPVLTVIRPILGQLCKSPDYRTYRSGNKLQCFDGHVSFHVANYVKRLWSQLKQIESDIVDPISTQMVSESFRDACDSVGVYEGVPIVVVPALCEEADVIVVGCQVILQEV